MRWDRLAPVGAVLVLGLLLTASVAAARNPGAAKLDAMMAVKGQSGGSGRMVLENFRLLGHHGLDPAQANADVWVHGNAAYVGT